MRHPKNYRYGAGAKLHRYPSVTLTILCSQCPARRGRYNLARLAHRYGPDMSLDALLTAFGLDPDPDGIEDAVAAAEALVSLL